MFKILSKALAHKYMDVTINTGNDFQTRIIEKPGLWMTDKELANLSKDLRSVANQTLNEGELTYGVFAGNSHEMSNTIITLVTRKSDDKPVAFNALVVFDLLLAEKPTTVLHLGLAMVSPEERSRGLSWVLYGLTCMLWFVRHQFRPVWISNVTQVPSVFGLVCKTFSEVYPSPKQREHRTLKHLLIARQIMANHRQKFGVGEEAGFDEDQFIITNAYTGGSDQLKKTFEEAPKHRETEFNNYCNRQLNYDRGDDVLQIGKIDLAAASRFIRDNVPRASLFGVLIAAFIAGFQKTILPIWHWFDISKHWGILRPIKK